MTSQPIDTPKTAQKRSFLQRVFPLLIIGGLLAAFFALGGPKYISLDYLRENQDMLKSIVEQHFWLALIAFTGLYAGLVAISFPGASLLSIFAGFLFGILSGTLAVVCGATLGATILFLIARSALGGNLAAKAGPFAQKFEAGLKENEFSYLFILRLVPIFPFFIVNIVPALFGVKLRNYILTTFLGIVPGSIVYVSVGNGIGDALKAGAEIPLSGLMFRPAVILPIIGLIILSLIPVLYKKMTSSKI